MVLLVITSALLSWSTSAAQTPATPIDASAIKIGPPVTVGELDLGKLKGGCSASHGRPTASELYIQTVDGDPPSEKQHHYLVPAAGGALTLGRLSAGMGRRVLARQVRSRVADGSAR